MENMKNNSLTHVPPYEKSCPIPRSTVPVALGLLYSIVIISLTMLLIYSNHRSSQSKQSVDHLDAEISELRKTVEKQHPDVTAKNSKSVMHFIEQLKRQGVDVEKLGDKK